MTRKKLKGTCLLTEFEPRIVKDVLSNKNWIEAMNETEFRRLQYHPSISSKEEKFSDSCVNQVRSITKEV